MGKGIIALNWVGSRRRSFSLTLARGNSAGWSLSRGAYQPQFGCPHSISWCGSTGWETAFPSQGRPGQRGIRLQGQFGKGNTQFYPKLPTPLNLSLMFNWGYDRKWVHSRVSQYHGGTRSPCNSL